MRRLLLLGLVLAGTQPAATLAHDLTHRLDPPSTVHGGLFSAQVATDGTYVAVNMPSGIQEGDSTPGLVLVHDGLTGARLHTLKPVETTASTFGQRIAVAEGRVLVPQYGSPGHARLVDAATGQTLRTFTSPDGHPGFGAGVALDGDRAAINAVGNFEDLMPGVVHVFELVGNAHVTLSPPPGLPIGSYFGSDLAIDGDLVAVATGSQGRVDVYDVPSATRLYSLTGFPTSPGVFSIGLDVALDGGLLVVGSRFSGAPEPTGSAKVYDAATGDLLHTLVSPSPQADAQFGASVSLSDGRLFVGEPFAGSGAGRVHEYAAASGLYLGSLTPDPALAPAPSVPGDDRPSATDFHTPGAGDGPQEGGGTPGVNLGVSVAAAGSLLVVGSWPDDPPSPDRGQARVYTLTAPRLRMLAVGIHDDGLLLPLRGDDAAALVHDSLVDAFDVSEEDSQLMQLTYDGDDPDDGLDNKFAILAAVNAWRDRVEPGDTFVFYLGSHGAFEEDGDEVEVCAQSSLVTFACTPSTGNEVVLTGTDGVVISDDELHHWFDHPDWDGVNKLFLIDACMSGGFWGTSADGDTGDLATLPRAALLASAPESKFSYSFPPSGVSYFAYAVASVLVDLGGDLTAGLIEELSFSMLAAGLAAEEGAMLDSFASSAGDFEGIVQTDGVFDMTPFHEQAVPAEAGFFAAATADFALAPGAEPDWAPRVLRVPRDVPTLALAVAEARPGDTVLVGRGSHPGPLVIEGKQGLTLRARGTRIEGGGVVVKGSSQVLLSGLQVLDAPGAALRIESCQQVEVTRCLLAGGAGPGVVAEDTEQLHLSRLRVLDMAGAGLALGTPEAPVHDGSVTRCLVADVAGDGLAWVGDRNATRRVRVLRTGARGLVLGGEAGTLDRCLVRDAVGAGVVTSADSASQVLRRCAVQRPGGVGVLLDGRGHDVLRLGVAHSGDSGLRIAGDGGHRVERLAVSRAAGDGVELVSPENLLTDARVRGCDGFGYHLHGAGTGNTLVRTRASGNALGPLQDTAGGNTIDEGL